VMKIARPRADKGMMILPSLFLSIFLVSTHYDF